MEKKFLKIMVVNIIIEKLIKFIINKIMTKQVFYPPPLGFYYQQPKKRPNPENGPEPKNGPDIKNRFIYRFFMYYNRPIWFLN